MVRDHCSEDNHVTLSKEKETKHIFKSALWQRMLRNNREIMIHTSQILPQSSQYETQNSKYQVT
jgi:hypothetical protein